MTDIPTPQNPSPWRRVTALYARLLEFLLAACLASLIFPVTLQIVSRYTSLIPSYIWTEEMARFMFIWTIMIGAMVVTAMGDGLKMAMIPFVYFLLLGFIAYGRWRLRPH